MSLTLVKRADERGDGSIDPLRHGREVLCGFAEALAKGQATMAPVGRLFITDHGKWVW
jgi:hypothetical protein